MALGIFSKLKEGLKKTRTGITEKLDNIIKSYSSIDEDMFDELEEVLITSDVGIDTTMKIIDDVKATIKKEKIKDVNKVKEILKENLISKMSTTSIDIKTPSVILVIGVNGVGKTTSIGKLAYYFKQNGKSVIMAAADTFRAAAIDQLEEWGRRTGVDVVKHQENADPSAVVFDAIQSAKSKKTDILICDTAGRLHNKKNLMNELTKMERVIEREYPEANREIFLVLDATTGQNALQQAKLFKEAVDITGIILTKLDGTAKGGIVIAINAEMDVPVSFIGVGEGIDDLQPFNAQNFIDALFEE